MLDLKELFIIRRWQQLHGEEAQASLQPSWLGAVAAAAAAEGPQPCEKPTWQRFPDPAGRAVVRWHAARAEELLVACEESLQHCKRQAASSRAALQHCRAQYDILVNTAGAVRGLLVEGGCIFQGVAEESGQTPRQCLGRSRCFFCRERIALEATCPDRGSHADCHESVGALADVSSYSDGASECTLADATESPELTSAPPRRAATPRVKRLSYRARGGLVFRSKAADNASSRPRVGTVNSTETWYAKYTEDPNVGAGSTPASARSGRSGVAPQASGAAIGAVCQPPTSLTGRSGSAPSVAPALAPSAAVAAVLSPFAAAAARFKNDFDFFEAENPDCSRRTFTHSRNPSCPWMSAGLASCTSVEDLPARLAASAPLQDMPGQDLGASTWPPAPASSSVPTIVANSPADASLSTPPHRSFNRWPTINIDQIVAAPMDATPSEPLPRRLQKCLTILHEAPAQHLASSSSAAGRPTSIERCPTILPEDIPRPPSMERSPTLLPQQLEPSALALLRWRLLLRRWRRRPPREAATLLAFWRLWAGLLRRPAQVQTLDAAVHQPAVLSPLVHMALFKQDGGGCDNGGGLFCSSGFVSAASSASRQSRQSGRGAARGPGRAATAEAEAVAAPVEVYAQASVVADDSDSL